MHKFPLSPNACINQPKSSAEPTAHYLTETRVELPDRIWICTINALGWLVQMCWRRQDVARNLGRGIPLEKSFVVVIGRARDPTHLVIKCFKTLGLCQWRILLIKHFRCERLLDDRLATRYACEDGSQLGVGKPPLQIRQAHTRHTFSSLYPAEHAQVLNSTPPSSAVAVYLARPCRTWMVRCVAQRTFQRS